MEISETQLFNNSIFENTIDKGNNLPTEYYKLVLSQNLVVWIENNSKKQMLLKDIGLHADKISLCMPKQGSGVVHVFHMIKKTITRMKKLVKMVL